MPTMITSQIVAGLEVFSAAPTVVDTHPTPLLFVHGAFAGAWMWTDTFMPWLAAAGYHCHAVSLRGHGRSSGRDHIDWHSISDYVADVATVADWIGAPPVLLGHSMGGFIVQKYLEHRDAPAAALICSVPPQGLIAAQFHLLFQKPHLFMDINSIMGGSCADTVVLRDALFASDDIDEGMLAAWLERMQAESHRAIWDMSMFNLPVLPYLQRPPMLVLGAERDILVPPFLVQAAARTYGVPDLIFRGMGHAVTHERNWQEVVGTIDHWLAGLGL